jgi:hypothetical protein
MSRKLRPLAALFMLAVIAAGCSNTSDGTGNSDGSSTASTHDRAVKFSECMRSNGVSAFPDPNGSGELTIDAIANNSSVDTDSAAFEQALRACKDLEPPGFTGYRRTPEQQKAALKFAECIRDHGVSDFPDPGTDDPLVDTRRIPSTARNGGMSILNAAMRTCGNFARGAGVTGER